MKSFLRGIIAIMVVSAILLLSDLANRIHKTEIIKSSGNAKSVAEKGRTYRLGLCYFAPEKSHDELLSGLWMRLTELGFTRDSNLKVIQSHANGEIGNIPSLLLNLDNQELDIILVTSTPCITASLSAVKNHPVAFTYCYDPIAAGVGTSFSGHRKGITGIGSFPPVEKTIDFIIETIPGTRRIGTIYNNAEANSRSVISLARKIADKKGIKLIEMPVINTSEVLQATQVIVSKNINALYISGDNTAIQAIDAIAGLCNKNSIPLIVNDIPLVGKGAMAGIGLGWKGVGYHSGELIAKMLNGADPDTIPLENYTNEEVLINQDIVKKLGVKIPRKYLEPEKNIIAAGNFKLALVHYVDSPNSEECEKGIRNALKDNNMTENVNYSMKVFNAQGDISTLNNISGSLSNEKWDLIFCLSTPTLQMMSKKLPDQKLVFTNVGDPVAAGAGKSSADHMPNICGVSTNSDFDGLLKLALLFQPGIRKIGTVYTPSEVNSVIYKDNLDEAARKNGLTLIAAPASNSIEVMEAAGSLVLKRIDAFCQISDNLTGSASVSIIKVARDNKIPYYAFVSGQVKQGAMAACARDYRQAGYEAGEMAVKVLKGADPGKIPFQVVSKTNFFVNRSAANYFKIPIPANIKTRFPGVEIFEKDN